MIFLETVYSESASGLGLNLPGRRIRSQCQNRRGISIILLCDMLYIFPFHDTPSELFNLNPTETSSCRRCQNDAGTLSCSGVVALVPCASAGSCVRRHRHPPAPLCIHLPFCVSLNPPGAEPYTAARPVFTALRVSRHFDPPIRPCFCAPPNSKLCVTNF